MKTQKTPHRILHVYPDFGAMGGIENYIVNLCVSLQAQAQGRFSPMVACSANGRLAQALKANNIPVFPIYTLGFFAKPHWRWLDLPSMLQYLAIMLWYRPKIVHVHIGCLENLLFKLLGCAMVYTVHGYSTLYQWGHLPAGPKRALKKALAGLFRFASRFYDRMCFVSQAERDRMIAEGYVAPHNQMHVIHNGLDVEALSQRAKQSNWHQQRQQMGLPRDATLIGFINRLDANKSPMGFLALIQNLRELLPHRNIHGVIIGDGPLFTTVLQAIRHRNMASYVSIQGFRTDIPECLAALDMALFLPSQEGFGLGIVEAMASGTLCMATATGGIPEILAPVEAGRFLLQHPDSWAQEVAAVLSAPPETQAEWKRALHARAQEAFTLTRVTQALTQIYTTLI